MESRNWPDIAWDEHGTFLAVADIDLPCTVLGCTVAVAQRLVEDPDLETVSVRPEDPIVA
ncbi:hypothetical protein L600_000100000590 [Isoptericola variabilis J7]|nr:hypothetical protein L600_000100000590 [Isoptericola variabilis J7]